MKGQKYTRVVVGLTTIPARVGDLGPVIASVAAQTRPPDVFYVSVPKFSSRENKPYPLDLISKALQPLGAIGKLNVLDQDYGPLTKLMGMLLVEPNAPGTLIITVDDDHALDPRLVQTLVARAEEFPRDVVAFSGQYIDFGRLLLPCWGSSDPLRSNRFPLSVLYLPHGHQVNIIAGWAGVAYPRRFFGTMVPDPEMELLRKPGTAGTILNLHRHDDMYISCWLKKLQIVKRVVSYYGQTTTHAPLPFSHENALCANDGCRTLESSVSHLKQWLKLAKTLQSRGLLERRNEMEGIAVIHDMPGCAALAVFALAVAVTAVVVGVHMNKKRH
jgi:hypothetical protein